MVDNEFVATILRSIYISGTATLLASMWSIPTAYVMLIRCRKIFIEAVIESLVGIPTVLLGLLLYLLLSSSGPLGFLDLLYTPTAIIIGESILVTPLIISTCYRSLKDVVNLYYELALSLGASRYQRLKLIFTQFTPNIVASVIMSFSRAVGELGIAVMVGGNIRGYTRVMTTAIALEVAKGNFEEAIALGLILLLIVISVSIVAKLLARRA